MILPEKIIKEYGKRRYEHIIEHPRISKQQLSFHFCYPDNRKLRKEIFTDEFLEKMEMTLEEYKKIRVFSTAQTAKIYELEKILFLRII